MDTNNQGTYTINKSPFPKGSKCICTHSLEAHGTNGMICALCQCKNFKQEPDALLDFNVQEASFADLATWAYKAQKELRRLRNA